MNGIKMCKSIKNAINLLEKMAGLISSNMFEITCKDTFQCMWVFNEIIWPIEINLNVELEIHVHISSYKVLVTPLVFDKV